MPWGAAIGAVGALGAAYMNKKNNSSAGGSTQQDSPQTIAASNDALGRAQTIAATPYQPYTGQVVAGMSAAEKQGSAQAAPDSALNNKASSLYDQAANDIAGVKQYNSDNLKSYMDPYVQATLNPVLNEENVRYANEKSALENAHAGAFGGDRSALQERSMDYAHSQALSKDIGDAYSQAFINAQHAFFQDQDKQINAGKALDQVAGDTSKLNTQQIQDLMATGGLSRALDQKQLDFNLNTFLTGQQWSTTQLQPLLQAIAASKGTSTSTQLYGPPSNVAGTAIGAAATVAGAYFTGGKSTTNNYSSGSYDSVSKSGDFGGANSYGSGYTFDDYGADESDITSDQRLKTDVVQLGFLPSGIPWYEFRYVYDTERRVHQGVLAHEVAAVFPDAVRVAEDGFLRVNYSRIH
jgi:hypothetical protein